MEDREDFTSVDWSKLNSMEVQDSFDVICNEIKTCIGVLGIQDICHFTSRDIGYYPFYFQGYGILCSIWDIDYLGKLIMGILANL